MPLFLEELFATKQPTDYVAIFELPARTSCFFRSLKEANDYALSRSSADVYFGLGLLGKSYGSGHRGKSKHVIAITCLWADIDIFGPGHERQDLPPTREAADSVLALFPLPPTQVVFSGGGYHLYWRLTECFRCDDDASRSIAESLVEKWQIVLRSLFRDHGWSMDSTHDLARVLRVPDTLNHKNGAAIPVEMVRHLPDVTYTLDQVTALLDSKADVIAAMGTRAASASGGPSVPVDYTTFTLNHNAQPPQPKWDILQDIEPKALDAWNHVLHLPSGDTTCSAYDLSIATYCAFAGWTDQEIVDLLVAHRRRYKGHADEMPAYYARTIGMARSTASRSRSGDFIQHFPDAQAEATPEEVVDLRTTAKIHLSEQLGVEVERILKYLTSPPTYRMILKEGSVMLADVSRLVEQTPFRHAIASTTGKFISPFKSMTWHGIAQALLNLCEDVDVGPEATDQGGIHAWLTAYLRDRREVEDMLEGLDVGVPFRHKGVLYISAESLRQWLVVHRNERINSKALGTLLRVAGAQPKALNAYVEGKKTSFNVWRIYEPAPTEETPDEEDIAHEP